jgi:hypothetical protein
MKNKLKFNRIAGIGFIFLAALVIFLPNQAQLQNQPGPAEDLPLMRATQREGHPKMQSVLYKLMKVYRAEGFKGAEEFARQRSIDMEGDFVRVVLESETGRANETEIERQASLVKAQVESLGGKVETSYRQLVQSLVPFDALLLCETTSEGVNTTGANLWHDLEPYRTQEQAKICILDAGFKGYRNLLGTELPSTVTTRSFRADGNIKANEEHGTACAEIVYDMAPNAEMWLVNFETDVEHHNAVDWIINQGVEIISYSLAWFNAGAGDGTGPICEDVERAYNNGIIWITAAGNEAQSHWEAKYRDPNSNKWCNFEKPGEPVSEEFAIYVFEGDTYFAFLNWDDWGEWTGTTYVGSEGNDYDLYLLKEGEDWTDWSVNDQTAGAPPQEWVGARASSTGWRYIYIDKYWAPRNCKLELFVWNGFWLEHLEPSGSIAIPADSAHAIAVGATDWFDDSYHSYSSRGPTSDRRVKPDLCAPSGISGSTYGLLNFYGTSASTPHVAGAFALLRGRTPYPYEQIKTILEARAVDLGPSGKDNKFGFGRLNLLE